MSEREREREEESGVGGVVLIGDRLRVPRGEGILFFGARRIIACMFCVIRCMWRLRGGRRDVGVR